MRDLKQAPPPTERSQKPEDVQRRVWHRKRRRSVREKSLVGFAVVHQLVGAFGLVLPRHLCAVDTSGRAPITPAGRVSSKLYSRNWDVNCRV